MAKYSLPKQLEGGNRKRVMGKSVTKLLGIDVEVVVVVAVTDFVDAVPASTEATAAFWEMKKQGCRHLRRLLPVLLFLIYH